MISPFRINKKFGCAPKDAYNTINLLLIDFLDWQENFNSKSLFYNSDYQHGYFGLRDSFVDEFGEKYLSDMDKILIFGALKDLESCKCFCGSQKPFRICHIDVYNILKDIDFDNEHIKRFIFDIINIKSRKHKYL
jgi:hypothetical protein